MAQVVEYKPKVQIPVPPTQKKKVIKAFIKFLFYELRTQSNYKYRELLKWAIILLSGRHSNLKLLYLYFWWHWGLNWGPHACLAGALHLSHSASPRWLTFKKAI
jgi:hypothetical protein